jgi:phage shock protein PspC (stress-responsive transcriptional regulator)
LCVGAVRIFTGELPDQSTGSGIFTAIFGVAAGVGAFFLLRPDLLRLREVSVTQLREWVLRNPIGQALALYLIAAIFMIAAPEYELVPALLAICIYSVAAPWHVARQRRWWAHAGLAVLGFCLMFFALAGTGEALAPRGFGEAGMLFLLPMEGFPVLLVVSGIVRLVRGAREQ